MPTLDIPSLSPMAVADRSVDQADHDAGEDSPSRPPVSPISPVSVAAELALPPTAPVLVEQVEHPAQTTPSFVSQPPSLPTSEDNTDVMALQSAISILQMQAQKSKQDMKTLQRIKNAALQDPHSFVEELKSGKLNASGGTAGELGPTLSTAYGNARKADVESGSTREVLDSQESTTSAVSSPKSTSKSSTPKFEPIPGAQNVYRMPHVNWNKYHVAGEALDRLHEEQRQRPSPSTLYNEQQGSEYMMAAPYSPLNDRLSEHPMSTRRASKRPG